jgi:hypothetical protein
MGNLKKIARFVRTTWLPAALVIVSTFILICSGYAGDMAFYAWHQDQTQRGMPLPPLSEWLAVNYGENGWDLVHTHLCFCWAFALLFVVSTFGPLSEFRRRFFTDFALGWSLIVAFWSFLALCASLPFLRLIKGLYRPPAIIPKLTEPLVWALPVLCLALLAWRLIRLFNERRRV